IHRTIQPRAKGLAARLTCRGAVVAGTSDADRTGHPPDFTAGATERVRGAATRHPARQARRESRLARLEAGRRRVPPVHPILRSDELGLHVDGPVHALLAAAR